MPWLTCSTSTRRRSSRCCARLPDGSKGARLIDHLALLVAGVAYSYQIEPVELTADTVRAQVLGNGRAPNDLVISSAHRAGWHVVDEREAMAALMLRSSAMT